MPAETPDSRPTTDPGTPAHVAAGASNGATTDDAGIFPEAVLRRAAGDPGSICRREDGETLPAWIARAGVIALTRRGMLLTLARRRAVEADALEVQGRVALFDIDARLMDGDRSIDGSYVQGVKQTAEDMIRAAQKIRDGA